MDTATGLVMPANSESSSPTSRAAWSRRWSARSWRAGASPASTSPIRPRSASRRWRRRSRAAGRSRSPPPSGWRRRSASRCARQERGTAPRHQRRRSRWRRASSASTRRPAVSLDRGQLSDAAALVRRQGCDLRLPDRNLLDAGTSKPDLPGVGTARRGLRPARPWSRCPTSPATSTSSPTGRANIAWSSSPARSTARCSAS